MDTLSFLVSHNPLFYTKVTWLCTLVWLSHEFVNLRDATRQDRGGCSSPPLRSSLARLLFLDQMHLLRCYTSPELCHRGLNEIGRTVSGGAGSVSRLATDVDATVELKQHLFWASETEGERKVTNSRKVPRIQKVSDQGDIYFTFGSFS